MMEHVQEESNCSMSVSLDLYSDILTEDVKYRENTFDELQNKFEEAQRKIASLENELATQQTLVHEYFKKNCTLESNISSLFNTAKRELHRKNNEIEELRNSTPRRHWNVTSQKVQKFSVHGGKSARLTPDSETDAAIFFSQANKQQAYDNEQSSISYRLRIMSEDICKTDHILSSSPPSRENRSKHSGKRHSQDRTLRADECNEVCDSSSSGRLKSRVKRRLSDEDIQNRSKRFRHESSRDATYDYARKLVKRSKKDITRRCESVERSLSSIRANVQRARDLEQENKHKTRDSDTESDRHYHRKAERISDRDKDIKIRKDESECSEVQIQSHRKSDRSPERGPLVVYDLREKLRLARQQKERGVGNTDRDAIKIIIQTPDKDLRGRSQKSDVNKLAETNKTVVKERKLSGDFVTVKRNSRYEEYQKDDHPLRTTRNFNTSEVDTEDLTDNSEKDDDSVKVTCKDYTVKRLEDDVLSSQFKNANKLDPLNNTCQYVINKQLVNIEKDFVSGTACEKHIHEKDKGFPDSHKDVHNLKGTEIHGLKSLQVEYNPGLEPNRESLKGASFNSDCVIADNTDGVIGEEYKKVEQLLAATSESVNDQVIVITSHEISKTSDEENKDTTYSDKEKKDTTDFSKENKDTTYSGKEKKETIYSNKENIDTTDFIKDDKDIDSNMENKDITKLDKQNMGITDFSKDNKDTDSNTENEATTDSTKKDKNTANLHKETQHTTDSTKKNKDTTYSSEDNKDTTDSGKKNKDTTYSSKKKKNTTDSSEENKDTTDLCKENKDTTDSYKETKDTTYSCKGNKDSSDLKMRNKDTIDLHRDSKDTYSGKDNKDLNLENKSITYSDKDKKCNTDSFMQNNEKSDSGRKNKDKMYRGNLNKTDSDMYHKNKTGLSNDKQKQTVKELSTNEVSRNVEVASLEQQAHKKDQGEKPLNNKEHSQDREQFGTSTAKKEKASIAKGTVKKLADEKSKSVAKLVHSEQTCGSLKENYPALEHFQDAAIECQQVCDKPLHNVSSKIDKASRGKHLGKVVSPAVQEVTYFDSGNLSNKDSISGEKKKNIVQELERRISTRKKPVTVMNWIVNSADVNVECNKGKLSKDRTSSPDNCAESVQLRRSVRNKEKCLESQGKEIKKPDIIEKSTHKNGKDGKEGENRCKSKEKGGKSFNTYLDCRMRGDSVKKKQANKITLKDDKDAISTMEDSLFMGNSNTNIRSNERNLVENSALMLLSPFKESVSADNSVVSKTAKITETISVVSSSDIIQKEVLEKSGVQKSKTNNGYTSPVLRESDKTDQILIGGSNPANWGNQRCFVTSETEYEFDSDTQSPHQGIYTYSPGSRYNRQMSVNRSGTTTRSIISSKPSSFAKICSSETDVEKSDRTDSGQSGDTSEMNSQAIVISDVEGSHSVDLIDYVSKQIEVEISKSPVALLPILPMQRMQNRIETVKRPDLPWKVKEPSGNKTNKYEEVVFDHTAVASMEGYFPKNSGDGEKNFDPSKEEEKLNTKNASGKPCEKFTEQKSSTNAEKRSFDNTTDNHGFVNKSTTKTCTNTSTALSLEKPDSRATEREFLPYKSLDCKRKLMEGTQRYISLESSTPELQTSLEKKSEKVKKFERPRQTSTFQISPVINSHSTDTSMESPVLSVSRTSNISQTSNRSGLLLDLLGEVSQEIIYLESSKKKAREKMIKKSKEETHSDYLLSNDKRDKASSSLNMSCDSSCYLASSSLDESNSPDKSLGTNCILEPSESISRISGLPFLFEDLDGGSNANKTTSHEQFQLEKEVDFNEKSVKIENDNKNSSPMTSSVQPEKGSYSETVKRDLETCLFGNVSSSSEDSQFFQITDVKCEQEDKGFTKDDNNAAGVSNAEIIDVNSLGQSNFGISLSKLSSEEKTIIMSTSKEDSSFDIYASIPNTSANLLRENFYIIEDEMITFEIPDQSQSHADHHARGIFSDGPVGDKSTAVEFLLSEKDTASQIRNDSPLKRSVALEEHCMEASMEESPVKGGSTVPILNQNAEGSHNSNVMKDTERKILLTPSPVKEHKSGACHHQLVTENLSAKFEKVSFSPRRQQELNDNKSQYTEYPFLMIVSPGKPCAQSSEKQCNILSMKSPMKPDNYSLDCLHGVTSPNKTNSPVIEKIVVNNFNVLPVLGSAQLMAEHENSGNVILHSHIDIISPGKISSARCNFNMERENTCSNDKSFSEHFGCKVHLGVRNEDKVVMPGNSVVQHCQTIGTVMQSSIIGDISSLPEKGNDEHTFRKAHSSNTCPGKSREFVKTITGEKFSKNGHPVITRKSRLRHKPSASKSVKSLIEAISNNSVKPGTPGEFDSQRRTRAQSLRTMETKNVIVSDVLHMQKNHSPVKVCHMSFQNKEMMESPQYFLINNSENKTELNMPSSNKKSKKSNRKQCTVENDIEKMEQSCGNERHTKSNEFSSRSPKGKISSADILECTENLRHSLDKPAGGFPNCLMNNISDICELQVEVYSENKLRSRSEPVNSELKAKEETCAMENRSKGPEKTCTNAEISAQIPHTSSPQRKRKESVVIFGNELSLHASEESLLNLVDPEIEKIHNERDSKMRLSKQADKGPNTEPALDTVSQKGPTVRGKKYRKVNSSKVSPEKEKNSGKSFSKRRKSNSKEDLQISLTSPWKDLRSSPRRSQILLSPQPCRDQVVGTSSARKRILQSPDKLSDNKIAMTSTKNTDRSAEKQTDNTFADISVKKSNLPKNKSSAKMLKNSHQSGNMGNDLEASDQFRDGEASDQFRDGRSKVSPYKKSSTLSTSLSSSMHCWTSPRMKKMKLLEEVFKSEDSRSPGKNPPPDRQNEKVMESNEFCAAQDQERQNETISGLQKSCSKKKLPQKGFAELTKKDESPQPKRMIPLPVNKESVLTDASHQIHVFANLEQVKSADSVARKISIPVTIKDDKNTEMEDQITASQMEPIQSSTVKEHQLLLEPVKRKRKLERCSIMVCNIVPQDAKTKYTIHESALTKNIMYVEMNYDGDAEKLDRIVLHRETDSKYNEKQLETQSRAKKIESSKERTVDSVRNRHIRPYGMDRVEYDVFDSGDQAENEFVKKIDGVKVLREEKLVLGQDERTDVEDDWDSIGDENDMKKDEDQHKEMNDSLETDEKNSPDTCAKESESDNDYYNDFYDNKESERVNLGVGKEFYVVPDDDNSDELDDLEEGEISLDADDTLNETLQSDKDAYVYGSEVRVPREKQAVHQNNVSSGDLAREDRERKNLVHQSRFSNKDSYHRSKQERKDDHSNMKQESIIVDKRLKSSLTKSERKISQRRSESLSKERSPKQRSSLSKSKSPSSGKKYLQRRSRTPQQRLSLSSESKSRSSEFRDRRSLFSRSRSKDRHRSRERCMLGSQKEHISPRSRRSRRHRSRDSPQRRVLTPERWTTRRRKSKEPLSSRGKSPVRFFGSSRNKTFPT
ncbi:hypothetical protein CHS0354_034164 [Potamilus streckersoni]|uniref:Uncharacterized protein n=1 Tax=Potamilus streckersoni TaxID=2493646 RepID=A0AAE0RNP5_9BIVA|nr:hypothetical protein CHS0354_034164 [Potamilus streckersoni]